MSLVSVLVALGLVSLLMSAIFSIINTVNDNIANIKSTVSAEDISHQLRLIIKNPAVCEYNITKAPNTFSTDEFDPTSKDAIDIIKFLSPATNNPLIEINKDFGQIRISKIKLMNFQPVITNQNYLATIRISLEKVGTSLGGKSIYRDIPVSLKTIASGTKQKIVSCWTATSLSDADMEEICNSMSGTWSLPTKKCSLPVIVAAAPLPIPAPTPPENPANPINSVPPPTNLAPQRFWQATPEVCVNCQVCPNQATCGINDGLCQRGSSVFRCSN